MGCKQKGKGPLWPELVREGVPSPLVPFLFPLLIGYRGFWELADGRGPRGTKPGFLHHYVKKSYLTTKNTCKLTVRRRPPGWQWHSQVYHKEPLRRKHFEWCFFQETTRLNSRISKKLYMRTGCLSTSNKTQVSVRTFLSRLLFWVRRIQRHPEKQLLHLCIWIK